MPFVDFVKEAGVRAPPTTEVNHRGLYDSPKTHQDFISTCNPWVKSVIFPVLENMNRYTKLPHPRASSGFSSH